MAKPLRALLVDDSEEDVFLLLRYLRRNGYEVASERVDTADGLRDALARGPWDIALCDYVMPLLKGEEALRILGTEAPELPVITVSGNVGEEYAVSVMRAGAKDYVRKDNLPRLIPAIERELADAVGRRERRDLEVLLVHAAWSDLRPASSDRRVELVVGDLPEVTADPGLLRQVVDNLLGNALKFTRPAAAPRVEVGSERRGGETVLYVRDNGVGFDPTRADRLFAVFQRMHRDDEFEGSGIGLSLVKRIIERHGGRVWAESTPGGGATFCFTLPPATER